MLTFIVKSDVYTNFITSVLPWRVSVGVSVEASHWHCFVMAACVGVIKLSNFADLSCDSVGAQVGDRDGVQRSFKVTVSAAVEPVPCSLAAVGF